jgi:hypothetical protein
MESIATKRTVLRLSTRHELTEHQETTHISVRYRDVGYGTDGKAVTPPSVSSVLEEVQNVRKVSVDRDYDGNLFITLEE